MQSLNIGNLGLHEVLSRVPQEDMWYFRTRTSLRLHEEKLVLKENLSSMCANKRACSKLVSMEGWKILDQFTDEDSLYGASEEEESTIAERKFL